jgi:hypothetical protein
VNSITATVGIPKIPKIPRLAIGADINPTFGGTAVVLGEGGKKETVTDYGKTNQLIQLSNLMAARALKAGGEGTVQHIAIDIQSDEDPRLIARAVGREL